MKSAQEIDKLISDNKRLIELEASRHATNLPLITVQIEAYKLAREAAKSYDPSVGKFSTHLVNSLKKLSRLSTKFGGTVRLPENTQLGINKLNKQEQDLEDLLGRPPSVSELADYAKMGIKMVDNLKRNKYMTNNLSKLMESPTMFSDSNNEWVAFVYHDLPPRDKLIFEHKTGFGGKPILSNDDICKKLDISPSLLNSRVKLMGDMLARGWK